jgi:hypothetical protein
MNNITNGTAYARNQFTTASLDFTVGPELAEPRPSWDIGGYTFAPNAFYLDVDSPITFTATVDLPPRFDPGSTEDSPPSIVIEYYWTFGDGTFGYGNPIDHQYKVANTNTDVRLRVTDDQGRRFFVQKSIYCITLQSLFPADVLFPSENLFPGP